MKTCYDVHVTKNSVMWAAAKAAMTNLFNAQSADEEAEVFDAISRLCKADREGFPIIMRDVFIEDYSEYLMQKSVDAFKNNESIRHSVAGMLFDWNILCDIIGK